MRNILLIARRDLSGFMHGFGGYAIVAAVLAIDGLLFNAFAMGSTAKYSHDVLRDFFYICSGTTMIASVMLTMPSFAEERARGTDVLLSTSPVRDGEIVLGKYLASYTMLSVLTLLTFYMPLLVMYNGKVSAAHIVVGYLGLFGLGAATTAIGVFTSSLVRNQFAAGLLAGVGVVSLLICWLLAEIVEAPLTDVVSYMSLFDKHFLPFQEGRLLLTGLVYYSSVSALFLWFTTKVVEGRRLS